MTNSAYIHHFTWISGELYEDNTKMLMQNIGAQQPIIEEEEEDMYAAPAKNDKNETDEEKKKRLEGKTFIFSFMC